MRSFGNLVLNEWLKLSKKRTFIVAYLIMAAFVAGFAYILSAFSSEPMTAAEFADGIMVKNGLGQIMLYIVIIGTAGIMAREHSMGTVKFLLIRAQSRTKILASKYVTMLIYLLSVMVFTCVLASGLGLLIFSNGAGESSWTDVFASIGYTAIYLVIYSTLTFMFGVLTKSAGATIGIGLFAVMLESLAGMLLGKYEFIKYLVFVNTDFTMYQGGKSPVEGMTPLFSAIVLSIYFVLFLLVSFVTFKRRDIA
ncbi:hypothetical protein DCC85_03620 [Paenibacillus sp. CAA11]|uniref:ABC transporter permease n=1 Tax=Paenibacillus sp. CAA11 TaxID=1532905 RepID=UPI000D382840|nr:DUF2705 family protein [Paenibacillus sp. CAA11]AWB43400.1 hypothetical protein DCC85_03620 [Paenibacillus sp. CAA11]